MNIRLATLKDLKSIQRLSQLLFESDHQYDKTFNMSWTYSKAGVKYFTKRLTHKNGLTLVAQEGSHVIGYLTAWVGTYLYRQGKHIAEVENIFVEAKYRNQGIGTALINHCQTLLKQRAITRLKVKTLFSNHPSIGFYKTQGFTEFALELEQTLNSNK